METTVEAGILSFQPSPGIKPDRCVGISLHDPSKLVSFETRARGGGIWSPCGLSVVGDKLFFATRNTFGAAAWTGGEAVFRVEADLRRSESKRDYFAPPDWKTLDAHDADLGGSSPLPLDFPGGGQALMLALGKDRKAYLLDRKSLGGQLAAETVSDLQIIRGLLADFSSENTFGSRRCRKAIIQYMQV